MLTVLSSNWLWIVLVGAMAFMHLGHGSHGGGHGGGGCGGHAGSGQQGAGDHAEHDHGASGVSTAGNGSGIRPNTLPPTH
jgi:hypothetical protein